MKQQTSQKEISIEITSILKQANITWAKKFINKGKKQTTHKFWATNLWIPEMQKKVNCAELIASLLKVQGVKNAEIKNNPYPSIYIYC